MLLVLCLMLAVYPAFSENTAEISALTEQARAALEAEDYETAVPLLQKAAEWYRKSLDMGYEPDAEDQKHIADVMGK